MSLALPTRTIDIDTSRIRDWDSFHLVFAEAFGFPDFYGKNMNAWIDCMTYLDDEESGMTSVHCEPGAVVTIALSEATEFSARCPEQFSAMVDAAAFVNWRRLQQGESAVLALAFYKSS